MFEEVGVMQAPAARYCMRQASLKPPQLRVGKKEETCPKLKVSQLSQVQEYQGATVLKPSKLWADQHSACGRIMHESMDRAYLAVTAGPINLVHTNGRSIPARHS